MQVAKSTGEAHFLGLHSVVVNGCCSGLVGFEVTTSGDSPSSA